jgi:hypothetical protein
LRFFKILFAQVAGQPTGFIAFRKEDLPVLTRACVGSNWSTIVKQQSVGQVFNSNDGEKDMLPWSTKSLRDPNRPDY